jgi:hypothetical protein
MTKKPLPIALLLASSLAAQIVNPADKQHQPQGEGQGQPLVVEGRQVSPLREEDRIGTYAQPEWTMHRRFGETRVYVRPEGTFEFEYWLLPEIEKNGPAQTAVQYEFEAGLPQRLQLDMYLVSHEDGNQGTMQFDQQKLELRWAFADWDKIFGNPTAYLEWTANNNAPDNVEGKLLFGGELCSSWHWGSNLVFEHATGALQENSYEWTGGVSKTIEDQRFSLGAEFKLALADDKTNRGDYATELLVGPSVQFRPLPKAHIDFAPLFGVTDDSPQVKFYIVFGWEF